MALPLAWKIISVAVAKKATVYILGRMYGYPRLYRRFLEFNKRRAVGSAKRKALQERVKYFFRVPNQVWARLWGQKSL